MQSAQILLGETEMQIYNHLLFRVDDYMHKHPTGNLLLYFCVLMNGLARFPELKKKVCMPHY